MGLFALEGPAELPAAAPAAWRPPQAHLRWGSACWPWPPPAAPPAWPSAPGLPDGRILHPVIATLSLLLIPSMHSRDFDIEMDVETVTCSGQHVTVRQAVIDHAYPSYLVDILSALGMRTNDKH